MTESKQTLSTKSLNFLKKVLISTSGIINAAMLFYLFPPVIILLPFFIYFFVKEKKSSNSDFNNYTKLKYMLVGLIYLSISTFFITAMIMSSKYGISLLYFSLVLVLVLFLSYISTKYMPKQQLLPIISALLNIILNLFLVLFIINYIRSSICDHIDTDIGYCNNFKNLKPIFTSFLNIYILYMITGLSIFLLFPISINKKTYTSNYPNYKKLYIYTVIILFLIPLLVNLTFHITPPFFF